MRKVLLSILLFMAISVQAQTWNEWFRQKKTQIRYLQRQIVALQVYIKLGQDGHGIARDGLQLISGIKNGDFDLHAGYFNSLLQVKPSIRHYGKAKEIISIYANIQQQVRVCQQEMNAEGWNSTDLHYLHNVLVKFKENVNDNMATFNELITNDHYSLKDEERLQRIEGIYHDINEQYSVIKYLYGLLIAIQAGRKGTLDEIQAFQKLYDFSTP